MASTIPEGFDVADSDLAEMVVHSDLRAAKAPEDRIIRELECCGYGADSIFAVKLALEEAITNAVKHGNKCDLSKRIVVRWHVDDYHAVVMVRDEGTGFCPHAVPDPTESDNLERPNGRGIMLMQSYMTRLRFSPSGNEVWMLKLRTDSGP